jgi:oligopeptide transport system ATP-binding protein
VVDGVLEVHGLRKEFVRSRSLMDRLHRSDTERVVAVDGVNLALSPGEALGLVGESGCGKSTLARCVVGIYEPTDGSILYRGRALTKSRASSERRAIQMIFQDPNSSLNPRMTVGQTLREVLTVHHMVPKGSRAERAAELLSLVGLPHQASELYPHSFSGGQRQRIAIARALAFEPEVLIADEPTSALDVSVQASILNLITDLQQRLNLTVLFISHNLAVVRQLCHRVAVMYLGRIVEIAGTETLFSDPRHPYTQALLAAVPTLTPGHRSESYSARGDPPSPMHLPLGCRFHPRCPLAAPECVRREPLLIAGPSAIEHSCACHFAWEGTPLEEGVDQAMSQADQNPRRSR